MNKNTLIMIAGAVLAIIIGAWLFFYPVPKAESKFDNFAKCLASKNVTMYGAEWCPHCQNEKKAFGDSFKYVPYVECPQNPKKCLEKNVTGYPTWIMSGGERLIGEQGLLKLSQASGCSLPLE